MADTDHCTGPMRPEAADAGGVSAPVVDFVTEHTVPERLGNEQPDGSEAERVASDPAPKVQVGPPGPNGAEVSELEGGQRKGLGACATNGSRKLLWRAWLSVKMPDSPAVSLVGMLLLMLGAYLVLFLFAGIVWLARMVHPIFLLLIPDRLHCRLHALILNYMGWANSRKEARPAGRDREISQLAGKLHSYRK